MTRPLVLFAALRPGPVPAQGRTERPGTTSATPAREGYAIAAASRQGSPDGRMVPVTLRNRGRATVRCIATLEMRRLVEIERCGEPAGRR